MKENLPFDFVTFSVTDMPIIFKALLRDLPFCIYLFSLGELHIWIFRTFETFFIEILKSNISVSSD